MQRHIVIIYGVGRWVFGRPHPTQIGACINIWIYRPSGLSVVKFAILTKCVQQGAKLFTSTFRVATTFCLWSWVFGVGWEGGSSENASANSCWWIIFSHKMVCHGRSAGYATEKSKKEVADFFTSCGGPHFPTVTREGGEVHKNVL